MRAPAAAANRGGRLGDALRPRETGIIAALGLMVAALTVFAPRFATLNNAANDARNFSFVGIAVLGEALVMGTWRIAGELPGTGATEEGIMALAALERGPGGVAAA